MNSEAMEQDDAREWDPYEPKRDECGRFAKGSSGNRLGRPRRRPTKPKSMARIMEGVLAKEVEVTDNGIPQKITLLELLIESMFRGAVKAKPKEILQIVQQTSKIAADAPPEEEEQEFAGIFTEDDRLLLEVIDRALAASADPICPNCNVPVPSGSPVGPAVPQAD